MRILLFTNTRNNLLLAITAAALLHLGLHANAGTNCAPVSSGLVSVWNGEATYTDLLGGNHGTNIGQVAFTEAKVGRGFSFDDSYVSVPNSQSLQLTNEFTIEMWFQNPGQKITEAVGLIAKRPNYGPCNFGINMYAYPGGRIQVYFLDPMYGDYQVSSIHVFPSVGQFHHLAAVFKQINPEQVLIKTYLDGALQKSEILSGNLSRTRNDEPIIIGATNPAGEFFYGVLDEVTLFNRALADEEIASIYGAGSAGKCFDEVAPAILVQPGDQVALQGGRATFNVVATGSTPLYYQWQHNEVDIEGATNSAFEITNLQQTDAGSYSVIVSNSIGWLESSNALVTVISTPTNCVPAPTGVVGFWRADGNALDSASVNNGSIAGTVHYVAGRVNQAFAFDGSLTGGVTIGNPAALKLQNFTIECWIKRASSSVPSPNGEASIFGYGVGGYALGMFSNGRLYLTKVGYDNVSSSAAITDTEWHHIAVSKDQGNVTFFVDGEPFSAPTYSQSFSFSSTASIGASGGRTFHGAIDELTIYNRGLGTSEIALIWSAGQAGKCAVSLPPVVVTPPSDRSVTAGATTTFNVECTGTQPLRYQWRFNDIDLEAGTNSSLTLTNIEFSQAGNYSVVVTNLSGATTSAWAHLTVTFPNAVIQLASTNVLSGSMVSVPVSLKANGNENGFGFSVVFSTSTLTFVGATLGPDASGATSVINTNLASSGKIGVAIGLDPGSTFTPGTRTILFLTFMTKFALNGANTTLSFSDTPVMRQLFDPTGKPISATFQGGTISLLPAQFEADVLPRPNGNQQILVNDWIQVGRYASRLDSPTNAAEFQRADCAPRDTAGNGLIGITDWVQAGRYAAAIDPVAPLGGPDSELAAPARFSAAVAYDPGLPRRLEIKDGLVFNQAGSANVLLVSEGDVNAFGFSLSWDPAKLKYAGASLGSAASGANLYVNSNLLSSGELGVAIALQAGAVFATGTQQVVRVQFRSVSSSEETTQVVFVDQPIPREVSDQFAKTLSTRYEAGYVAVNPVPSLAINRNGSSIGISWPAWATNYTLQRAFSSDAAQWENNPDQGVPSGDEVSVSLSPEAEATFFRLRLK
ncbi:MAG TPA: LamG-like jellyroll fold domain-containing protein [Clostridia bacterium]|nr:LamG-like jellyroll fold domain-containing protein [Clostridia bacterium]